MNYCIGSQDTKKLLNFYHGFVIHSFISYNTSEYDIYMSIVVCLHVLVLAVIKMIWIFYFLHEWLFFSSM